MSELKVYHCNEWHNEYTEFYLKSEADKVIAEKDKTLAEKDKKIAELESENAQLMKEMKFMHSNCGWHVGDGCARLLGEKLAIIDDNVKLKQKLEDAKATHYAEMVDAGMENRRLKRALWLSRAMNARNSYLKWNLFANFESEDKLFTIDEHYETHGVTDFSTLRTYEEWCKVWQNVGRKCLEKAEEYK